jgi:hypothetical protein
VLIHGTSSRKTIFLPSFADDSIKAFKFSNASLQFFAGVNLLPPNFIISLLKFAICFDPVSFKTPDA